MIDIGYGIRLAALVWKHKGKQANKNLFAETIVNGRCWANDLDTNMHMNNSRYLRECDFGRISLLLESGLWNVLFKRRKTGIKDANIVVTALQAQFRQSLEWGDRFKIYSRINGWDDKAFYLEQWITLDKTNEIVFSLLARMVLIPRSLTPQMLIDDLQIGRIESPKLSPNIQIFKENHRISFEDIKSKL
jgi:acyl-CoA thioesterase FadM